MQRNWQEMDLEMGIAQGPVCSVSIHVENMRYSVHKSTSNYFALALVIG